MRADTGGCYVKYNAVLRGLAASAAACNDALRSEMLRLCCDQQSFTAYRTCVDDPAATTEANVRAYETARRSLNTFTTTLHCINSAVLKLSKLTFAASSVYRGVAGRVLPDSFMSVLPTHLRWQLTRAACSRMLPTLRQAT